MLIIAVSTLAGLGLIAAIVLYFVASKFKVYEDPKIDEVEEALPSANCGGCGFPGCRAFAEATVKSAKENKTIDGLFCPVGGNEVMQTVGSIVGLQVEAQAPLIAVVRCNGTSAHTPAKVKFEGVSSCAFAHTLYVGEGGCMYGCLGEGDCVAACDFDAIHMDPETGLPVVNDKCTACGACVDACPRSIIELRKKGPKDRRIFVSCVNQEKGAPAKKNCEVACIGCAKCVKACKFDAITLNNFLAYIDFEKCTLCRKCVEECPTDAIWEVNFKPRKPKIVAVDMASEPVIATAEKPANSSEDNQENTNNKTSE
ncbi:MAG: RnfABCDGE type electron transport complex subunit B [Bacteroidales bacterium]|nr:RnfABCDGE type electron transport complex subunit B [Bacteroidales bacterium]